MSKINKQPAIMCNVINRLTSKSTFEAEGWKRIYGVMKFFEAFDLTPDDFELEAIKVTHPIAIGNRIFQEKVLDDKNQGTVETSMNTAFFEVHQKTFKVDIL